MAHKLPEQLKILVDLLAAEGDEVQIHIDKKADERAFTKVLPPSANVRFSKVRFNVHWGGYSQVKCVLYGLNSFLKSDCDYFFLLSGQDLPLKPLSELKRFIRENKGRLFMQLDTAENNWGKKHARISKYYLVDRWAALKQKAPRFSSLIDKAEALYHYSQFFVKRKFRKQLFGGSAWFVIEPTAARYIIDRVEKEPQWERFFRFTISPDEMIFHTILGNSPFRNNISAGLTFARFSRGSRNPDIIRETEIEDLINTGHFFARKFDGEVDRLAIKRLSAWHAKG